jgi:hypothetical protein
MDTDLARSQVILTKIADVAECENPEGLLLGYVTVPHLLQTASDERHRHRIERTNDANATVVN